MSAANDGDLIQVRAGTYEECVDLGGMSLDIAGLDGSTETILDGGGACGAAIRLAAGETANLSGLTITNPGALGVELVGATVLMTDVVVRDSGDGGGDGGGISALGGSLRIVSGTFTGNEAERGGALFAGDGAAVQLTDVYLASNQAGYGGAIAAERGARLDVQRSTFEDNTATDDGGALYAKWEVSAALDQVSFDGNVADDGGAVHLSYLYGAATMSSVTFTHNVARDGRGGAVRAYSYVSLSITTGHLSGNTSYESGGAIYAYNQVEVVLDGVRFDDNLSETGSGGAIYHVGGEGANDLTVEDCRFTDNSAEDSGGAVVYSGFDDLRIDSSAFDGNIAGYRGGALWTTARGVTAVLRSRFCMNEADDAGGAVAVSTGYGEDGSGSWQSDLFQENRSDTYGGALWLYGLKDISLSNNTLVGNDALIMGGALWSYYAEPTLINNVVAYTVSGGGVATGDTRSTAGSTFTYNDWYENLSADVAGTYTFSTTENGNLTEDPGFADYTLDGDCDNDDLSLAAGSALIDAGDPSLLDADGSVSDIGAFGGVGYVPLEAWPDEDGDGYVSELDCDETDGAVFPGADEACDGVDNDCDGEVDEIGAEGGVLWYADADGDGYGDADSAERACEAPEGSVAVADDCDDGDASAYPGAEDAPGDWIDQDCDGTDAVATDTGDTSSTDDTGDTATPAETGAAEETGGLDTSAPADSADSGSPADTKAGGGDDPSRCGGCASAASPRRAGALSLVLALCALAARRSDRAAHGDPNSLGQDGARPPGYRS